MKIKSKTSDSSEQSIDALTTSLAEIKIAANSSPPLSRPKPPSVWSHSIKVTKICVLSLIIEPTLTVIYFYLDM